MKNKSKIYLCTIIVVTLCLSSIIVSLGFVAENKSKNPTKWVLHSYGNNVALYNGNEIIEVYGSVLLDTLPPSDKHMLDMGIVFSTREEAMLAIEDYDG